jgi:hypothetical protein
MGGSGSGNHYHWWRGNKKVTVEWCRSLDANRWMREGILKSGVWQSGSWCWYRDATRKEFVSRIGYEVNTTDARPWVRLSYTFTESGTSLDYKVFLRVTRPHFGGLRWWFVCPLTVGGRTCARRVGKLYLPPGAHYYGCRRCYHLTYTSCQQSRKYDSLYRRMAASTGYDLATVKWAMNQIGKRPL